MLIVNSSHAVGFQITSRSDSCVRSDETFQRELRIVEDALRLVFCDEHGDGF